MTLANRIVDQNRDNGRVNNSLKAVGSMGIETWKRISNIRGTLGGEGGIKDIQEVDLEVMRKEEEDMISINPEEEEDDEIKSKRFVYSSSW